MVRKCSSQRIIEVQSQNNLQFNKNIPTHSIQERKYNFIAIISIYKCITFSNNCKKSTAHKVN